MAEYMRKDVFLSSMGLTGDETKYGNHDAEHQHRSYSTYMSYEIIDSVEDSIVEEELAPVRHGRWINERMLVGGFAEKWGCDCSECGKTIEEPLWKPNYCPNCGCKMYGGDDHAEE